MTKRKSRKLKRGLFIRTANKTKKLNVGSHPQRGGFRF